jgi:predicted NAD/FAD-binding protein
MGYGFHEDGFKAGRSAANGILQILMQEEAA